MHNKTGRQPRTNEKPGFLKQERPCFLQPRIPTRTRCTWSVVMTWLRLPVRTTQKGPQARIQTVGSAHPITAGCEERSKLIATPTQTAHSPAVSNIWHRHRQLS